MKSSTSKTSRRVERNSVASNAIQTIDKETAYLIIYCLNCIGHDGNLPIFYATCLPTQSKNKTEYFSAPLKNMLHAATS